MSKWIIRYAPPLTGFVHEGWSGLTILAIVVALGLAGCQHTQPQPVVRVVAAEVPAELRRCLNAPGAPKGENVTQKDVAKFLVGLGGAYRDCKNKLGQVDKLLTEFKKLNEKSD